jgi:hypothetical protein
VQFAISLMNWIEENKTVFYQLNSKNIQSNLYCIVHSFKDATTVTPMVVSPVVKG